MIKNINTVTFVTSYLKIYDEEYDLTKTFEKRLDLFLKLLEERINVCIFISPEFETLFKDLCIKYDNLKIIEICSIEDSIFSKMAINYYDIYGLPEKRSIIKDTKKYMLLMNSKIEYVKKSIDLNPFNTNYFAWFDFSLPYIFKYCDNTIKEIVFLSEYNYTKKFLAMPGCWNNKFNDIEYIKNNITWRFCGGFFIGDKETLINFYDKSVKYFVGFLDYTKTFVWEVNYWAFLEANDHINPLWYNADHNDSIVHVPHKFFINKLFVIADNVDIIDYKFPTITSHDNDIFFPASSSYIYDYKFNKHIINTRYVNYYYKDDWECDFFNSTRTIKTINRCTELDENFCPKTMETDLIANFIGIDETDLIGKDNSLSFGLEDIRLFYSGDSVKFIASNANYIENNTIKIITGDYDYKNNICSNCKIIKMLWDSNCEKNWAPIQYNKSDINNLIIFFDELCGKNQYFIYKWSPFIVGYIDDNNCFQIKLIKHFNNTYINKFRGSSCFINYDETNLIGVVHYSVKDVPPVYYHVIVLLDKKTLLPMFYSCPFKFNKQPIEFCIGFTIHENKYLFWISQMDREPLLIKIDVDKIPILNLIN